MQKLLIAIDGSAQALEAVRYAIELVRDGLRANFVLANVQAPANLYEVVVAHDPQVLHNVSQQAGANQLAAAQSLVEAAGIAQISVVESGDPAQVLIDLAQRHACSGVFLGAQGHSAVHDALLGSVSRDLVHHCPVPVTVVKPPQENY